MNSLFFFIHDCMVGMVDVTMPSVALVTFMNFSKFYRGTFIVKEPLVW